MLKRGYLEIGYSFFCCKLKFCEYKNNKTQERKEDKSYKHRVHNIDGSRRWDFSMNIKINLPEHNKIAEFRAKLIMECIKQQNISSKKKNLILEELIKKLESDV